MPVTLPKTTKFWKRFVFAFVVPFAICILAACIPIVQSSTEQQLAQVIMPTSDPRDLAIHLRPDVDSVPRVVNSTSPNYEMREQENFWVLNVQTRETRQISATLLYKTDVAYAWVESDQPYDRDLIVETVEHFSTHTYPLEVAFFGGEWNPGVDNDPRLHILHATGTGSVAGFFSSASEYSRLIYPYSNEKESST